MIDRDSAARVNRTASDRKRRRFAGARCWLRGLYWCCRNAVQQLASVERRRHVSSQELRCPARKVDDCRTLSRISVVCHSSLPVVRGLAVDVVGDFAAVDDVSNERDIDCVRERAAIDKVPSDRAVDVWRRRTAYSTSGVSVVTVASFAVAIAALTTHSRRLAFRSVASWTVAVADPLDNVSE